MPTLETRLISGKGVVKIPQNTKDYTQAKIVTVYATVVRRATSEYLNFAYNPPRSRYCTLNFMRKGYVIMSASMEYSFQSWDFYPEISAQTLYAVECAYQGILQTFVNLGNALSLVPISVTNNIEDWVHTNLLFDEIKVVCYADTAVQISVRSNKYDLCPDQENKDPDDPPPPPLNPPVYDPGTPLNVGDNIISPPYDGENDFGDTIPHPIDEPPPPPPEFPQGGNCVAYRISVRAQRNTGGFEESTGDFYGAIDNIGLTAGGTAVTIISKGLWLGWGSPCSPTPTTFDLMTNSGGYVVDSLTYTITPL